MVVLCVGRKILQRRNGAEVVFSSSQGQRGFGSEPSFVAFAFFTRNV